MLAKCVGGWQGRSWERQRPLEEKLHSWAVVAGSVLLDTLLAEDEELQVPRLQLQTGRSHMVLEVDLCLNGEV